MTSATSQGKSPGGRDETVLIAFCFDSFELHAATRSTAHTLLLDLPARIPVSTLYTRFDAKGSLRFAEI